MRKQFGSKFRCCFLTRIHIFFPFETMANGFDGMELQLPGKYNKNSTFRARVLRRRKRRSSIRIFK